eukprot:scaffold21575_cov172-Skeletonema_dohrnii-CCMP3373.AAC.3
MAKSFLTASTMLLICTYITTSGANSNMVSITHRSSLNGMSNNYSSGLNIVKSSSTNTHTNPYNDYTTNNDDDNNEPEEYVTDFYRQKRLEKRELAAKTVARSNGGDHHLRSAADHSLDHYFDHHDAIVRKSGHLDDNVNDGNSGSGDGDGKKRAFFRRSNVSGGSNYDGIKNKRPAFLPNSKQQHARVASSVRGGGSITQHVRSKHSNNNHYGSKKNEGSHHQSRRNHQQRHSRHPSSSATFAPYRRRNSHPQHYQRHGRTLEESDMDEFNSDHDTDDLEEEYDEHDDYSSNHHDQLQEDDNDANSTPPHQAGLLRVPCSLRLNSSENTNDYHSHSSNNNKSTPIAAYVDTGAQVTVISAAAARKVGILHLMDRRYAGRATGVGQCRILGRIPAGCVHFMLGQREDDDHHEDYDDDDDYEEEERSIVQMNGPALTVLEGTVTEGVDMLLGLDVLQDWEATIQMGGNARQSSITVKKRGMSEPVVLPFLVGDSSSGKGDGKDRRRRSGAGGAATTSAHHGQQQHQSRRNHHQQQKYQQRPTKTNYQHDHDDRRQQQRHVQHDIAKDDEIDEEEDLFSPFSSDIESDLDILDQSEFTHEFPDEGRRRVKQCSEKIVHDIEREDELLGVRHSQHYLRKERDSDNDDDDDFLQDSSDDEEEEVTFDMSGL